MPFSLGGVVAVPDKRLKIKPQTTSTIDFEGRTLDIAVTLREWQDEINDLDRVKVEINCAGKSIKMAFTRFKEKGIEVK